MAWNDTMVTMLRVLINDYGEAHMELVMLTIIVVMLSLGMYYNVKELKKT